MIFLLVLDTTLQALEQISKVIERFEKVTKEEAGVTVTTTSTERITVAPSKNLSLLVDLNNGPKANNLLDSLENNSNKLPISPNSSTNQESSKDDDLSDIFSQINYQGNVNTLDDILLPQGNDVLTLKPKLETPLKGW